MSNLEQGGGTDDDTDDTEGDGEHGRVHVGGSTVRSAGGGGTGGARGRARGSTGRAAPGSGRASRATAATTARGRSSTTRSRLRGRTDRSSGRRRAINEDGSRLDGEVVGVDAVRDGRVGHAVGSGGDGVRSRRSDGVSDSPLTDGTVSSVGTGVSLSESRGSTAGQGVQSGGSSSVTLARRERVVGLVEVADGHDELTAHDVELVLTHQRGRRVLGLSGTDSETELVVRDE